MAKLSVKQQYRRIIFMGVLFMLMFTSFNSLQNIISKLYEEYHYDNLGQTAIMFLYAAFGVTSLFSSFIVKNLGYKKTMILSSLCYAIFEATGLLIAAELKIASGLVWVIVVAGAVLCGMGASALWVAQGAYTSEVADENRKNALFGMFWALMMASQITGNLLTTFLLGKLSNFIYFLTLTIFGCTFLFMFLPNVEEKEEPEKALSEQSVSIKEELVKVMAIIKDRKYLYINIYFWFPGLTISFYAGFLYKLITASVKQESGESEDDYLHRLKFYTGLVFLSLGLSEVVTGLLMNRVGELFCKFKLAVVGTIIVEISGLVSLICYFTESYPLCFVCAYLWGTSENFLQTNTGGLIAVIFPGKVQAYSVYRVFFSVGIVSVLLLEIALSNVAGQIFLSIVLGFQTIITVISLQLKSLDQSPSEDKNSLLTNH